MVDVSGNSLGAGPDGRKRRVIYYYDDNIGNYYYGRDHVMKPHRIRLTHSLVKGYGLNNLMKVVEPPLASFNQLSGFHNPDYVAFLCSVRPETQHKDKEALQRFNMSQTEDCPVFDDLYSFCQTSAGGSIAGAVQLNKGDADIAINWAGGLHHAKKCGASGFCYINDIVLGILELLKHHGRVLYIDIDVHHGDGVEEAFYTTDRVMTVSFHQFGDGFFPRTGHLADIGYGKGKHYSLNVPMKPGIDNEGYQSLFKPIISKVMAVFQPGVVVLQCGADSLDGDKLGGFNLSLKGHAECVKFLRSFNVPLMLLGGGGYTISNVARCWCYETAVALDMELDDTIPDHTYVGYYGPASTLHFQTGSMKNHNTQTYLDYILETALKNLSEMVHTPSVQFSERLPDTDLGEEAGDEEQEDLEVQRDKSPWTTTQFLDLGEEEEKKKVSQREISPLTSVQLSKKPRDTDLGEEEEEDPQPLWSTRGRKISLKFTG